MMMSIDVKGRRSLCRPGNDVRANLVCYLNGEITKKKGFYKKNSSKVKKLSRSND